jgi:hypothetical protein
MLIPNEDENAEPAYASIETLTLEYSNGETNDNGSYVFDEIPFFVASTEEYRDAVHDDHKDSNFQIDPESYRLSDDFGTDGLTDDDIAAFNLVTEKDDLSAYNGVMWRIMLVYVLVVVVITYFLFFHKYVRQRLQMKKQQDIKVSKEAIFKDEVEGEK